MTALGTVHTGSIALTPPGRRPRRRVLLAAVAAVVLFAGLLVALARSGPAGPTLPSSALLPGERYAVDVSHHQGAIDWGAVAADGVAAAYVKATEGGDYVDERFAAHWKDAGDAGLQRGAYHFFTLCRHGAEQATNFLRVAKSVPGALPPALDLELEGNCPLRPARADLLRELRAFIAPVQAAWGRPPLLYTDAAVENAYSVREGLGLPLWTRSLGRRPAGDWQVWQRSATAQVAGVTGPVDLNVLRAGL